MINPYELDMMRLEDLYHQYTGIPEWAKAEQLERHLPQIRIWRMTDQPQADRKGRHRGGRGLRAV